jgi:hypothetical protein
MNRDNKPASPLYASIIAERKREFAFAAWREKVVLFKSLFNGAGMSMVNRRFRPWKEPGLKRKQSYKTFLRCYKFYYASKRALRDVLNDLIFHQRLRGEELTTAFANCLIQLGELSNLCTGLPPEPTEKEEVQASPVDDKSIREPIVDSNEERSSSDESLGTPGYESNWDHNDDVSYDSDDAYDINMFPGYGRGPRADSGPTFTYPERP